MEQATEVKYPNTEIDESSIHANHKKYLVVHTIIKYLTMRLMSQVSTSNNLDLLNFTIFIGWKFEQ